MVERDSQVVKGYSVEGLEQQFGEEKAFLSGVYRELLKCLIRHGGGIVKDQTIPKRLRKNKTCLFNGWDDEMGKIREESEALHC